MGSSHCLFPLLLHPALPDWTEGAMVETAANWRVDERERCVGGRRERQIKGRQSSREVEME